MATSAAPSRLPPYQKARSLPPEISAAVALWTERSALLGRSCVRYCGDVDGAPRGMAYGGTNPPGAGATNNR